MYTILAVIGGLWIVGRLSRRSLNHPINSVTAAIRVNASQRDAYPVNGPTSETAQIQGSIILGEGGGE